MAELKFKTNIKCNGCIAKVAPVLDKEKNINKWKVDLNDPERTLVVEGEIKPEEVQKLLGQVGYKAEIK
ncbi:MAG: heavy metal-associated domain-containing protein [Bacteroidota bacterium]|nr:heavy metal-associated domain-containing protein [Bacteroidota bacterium]MDP4226445.1 heavy metal-associated domain-containing protein [Bacteroidota bacterium]MDP4273251.1 heavy metal-associated domain-containing protein [Bacteroidota bacterium]